MTSSQDIPQRLGRYTVIRPLGQGGMGQVYLAKDPDLDREVAIKTISLDRLDSPKVRDRFLHEAKASGTLTHPNLITIHEFGQDQGVLYLVMEYLPGQDLSVFLHNRMLSPKEVLEVMAQVCDGLAYAHSKGVIHRDIKPSNIRVRRETGRLFVKILDFGVARLPGSKLTATGDIVGTFAYMDPEYLRTGEASVRSDLFAVGMMLHEGLTGVLPSMVPTVPGQRLAWELPADARHGEEIPGISRRIWEVVDKALAANPAHRFASAEFFSRVLRQAQDPAWAGLTTEDLPMLSTFADTAPGELPPPRRSSGSGSSLRTPSEAPASGFRLGTLLTALSLIGASLALWMQLRRPAAAGPSAQAAPAPVYIQQVPAPAAQAPAPVQAQAQASSPVDQAPKPLPPAPSTETASPDADLLQQAESRIKDHPAEAYDIAQRVLREQPALLQAHALTITSLYYQARYPEMPAAFEAAKGRGLGPMDLGSNPAMREMLQEEGRAHRIPPGLMDSLRPYLPPGPRSRQGGMQPNPRMNP